MDKIVTDVINFLNMGISPTIITLPDNGIYYLYEELIKNTARPTGYDLNFIFVPVNFQALKDLTLDELEEEINEAITLSYQNISDIVSCLQSGNTLVIITEDLEESIDFANNVALCNLLIKKYRGKVRVIYTLEDPLILNRIMNELPSDSSILEGILFFSVLNGWNAENLAQKCAEQFKQTIPSAKLSEILQKSGRHYGIFKRFFKDILLESNSIDTYIESLLKDFSLEQINTLKKLATKKPLTTEEVLIKNAYKKIDLVNANNEITIPILQEKIQAFRIRDKIQVNNENNISNTIDWDLLSRSEKEIIEYMLKMNEEVTKEEIAKIIWKDQVDEMYSEWAIDQRISRLKRKLLELGFDLEIKTVYGKGYKAIKP